jgi:hypothetical protein
MASVYNFTIDQGSDFSLNATYQDANGTAISLTGKTLAAKARRAKEEEVAFSFSFTIADQTSNTGEFAMTLASAVSSALDISQNNKFLYDVELTDSGVVTRLFQGVITMSREITR